MNIVLKINRLNIKKLFFPISLVIFLTACTTEEHQNDIVLPYMNITIDPNITIFQELNVPGGWMYLGYEHGVDPPSRGVIVYRLTMDEFMAYDRMPPYKPDSCCNGNVCTQLLVDGYYPYVMDTCTGSKFIILDGLCVEGPSPYPLLTYKTEYQNGYLYIHN